MLLRRRSIGILFQYPIPQEPLLSPQQPLCIACISNVFNRNLSTKLIDAWEGRSGIGKFSYIAIASNIRQSYIEGCKWCKRIVKGIYTSYALLATEGMEEVAGDEKMEDSITEDEMGKHDILNNSSRFHIELSFIKESHSTRYSHLTVRCQHLGDEGNDIVRRLRDENAVELVYQVQSSPGTWSESVFDRRADYELASEVNFKSARAWVDSCKEHLATSSGQHTFKPARLIDTHCPRLVASSEIPHDSIYVALSYVWGPNQNYVLTKDTMSEKMDSLDMNLLSGSIAEAIHMSRRLGFKYLWVDALCIIQDSNEDKNTELAKMSSVYQYAALTIVAANSASAHSGFLTKPIEPDYLVSPFEVPFYPSNNQPEAITLSYVATTPDRYKREKDPINSRAWTLQEQLLSSHMLVFSYEGMQKICRKNRMECTPQPQLRGLTSYAKIFGHNGLDFTNTRQAWESICTEYTERQLTHGSDKLSAVAAVAEEIGREWGGRYLAGLWEDTLLRDLQWKRGGSRRGHRNIICPRSTVYRAPSWSWASIDSRIDFRGEGDERRAFDPFKVLSCKTELFSTTLPYGPVRGGILEVRGVLRSSISHKMSNGSLMVHFGAEEDSKGNVSIWLDAVEPDLGSQTVHLLPMFTFLAGPSSFHNPPRDPKVPKVDGLLLVDVDGGFCRPRNGANWIRAHRFQVSLSIAPPLSYIQPTTSYIQLRCGRFSLDGFPSAQMGPRMPLSNLCS